MVSRLEEQYSPFLKGFRIQLQGQGSELNFVSRNKSLYTQLCKQKIMENSD